MVASPGQDWGNCSPGAWLWVLFLGHELHGARGSRLKRMLGLFEGTAHGE
jgi:hypothetical protein